jgi:hypothetical protein
MATEFAEVALKKLLDDETKRAELTPEEVV